MSHEIDNEEYQERFDEMLNALKEEYGTQTVMRLEGTSGLWPEDKIIRTGSIDMDMAIGIGGWPRGGLVQVQGMESSGKTTLAIMTIAQAQKQGLLVAVIDAENSMDPNWMRRHGVDTSKVIIIQPAHLEQAIDLIVDLFDRGVDLVVLDSIAALKSKEIMNNAADKETRALEARRWSAQLPRIIQSLRNSQYVEGEDEPRPGSLGLFINQKRESMDMYTAATSPGGKALKFNMRLIVDIKRDLDGKRNEDGIDSHTSIATCEKNKVGSPFKKARWTLYTREGLDIRNYLQEAIDCGAKYDIVFVDVKSTEDGEWLSKKNWRTVFITGPAREYIEANRESIDGIEEAFDKGSLFYDTDDILTAVAYHNHAIYSLLESFGPGFVAPFEDSIRLKLNIGDGTDSSEEQLYMSDEYDSMVDEETGEILSSSDEAEAENEDDESIDD